ncbi:hypothetical protein SAMN06272721_11956 [Arthrobacter sp. P2b]|nr:hypothetical protein SAMN06272721_11956 [Arthrobacter sp. P2b]
MLPLYAVPTLGRAVCAVGELLASTTETGSAGVGRRGHVNA